MSFRAFVVLATAVAIGLATAVAPLASSSPDGLERVAHEQGFAGAARADAVQKGAPAPGYAFPGIGSARVATGVAGFAGTLVTFAAGWALVALLGRSRRRMVT